MTGLPEARWFGSAACAAALILGALTADVCLAAHPVQLAGSIKGSVQNSGGVPQMGAVVQLFNRNERLIERVMTNAKGEFLFANVLPDMYSIKVSLASFVPAIKRNISIQPGMQSVLAINLANVLSSVELVYTAPNSGTLMSDDWKWVLRSTMSTRPVTRVLDVDISDPNNRQHQRTAVFSDTKGMLKLSSGETLSPFTEIGQQPDLGTTFALATSVFGGNQIQVSGNVGYMSNSDMPMTAFRTSFSRPDQGSAVKVTVQQVALPFRSAGVVGANAPALRSMSVTSIQRMEIAEGIDFDYGASLDSVTYLDRLNYFSPFARLRYNVGGGRLTLGYSSGAPPVDLLASDPDLDAPFQGDLAALSVLPRVSLRNGRAHVQRSENMEIGYRRQAGRTTYAVGVYHEFVRNAALTMSTPDGLAYTGDLLPELSSNSSVFNIGNYSRSGFTLSASRSFLDQWSATVAVGRGGVLGTNGRVLQSDSADELRGMITRGQRMWVRGMLLGVVPGAGTHFNTSYEWTDSNSLTPGHVYLTQNIYPQTGLNVRLRQPVPIWRSLPGRLEATAELRNLLAQGYLPVGASGGRRLLLAHYPRAIRGGLSFIF